MLLPAGIVFGNSGVPSEGVVYEGDRVPGITLDFTRGEVIAAYGDPSYCQSITSGDFAFCTYNTQEGSASVRYQGSDGGDATASDSDILYVIYWIGLSGWVTTTGINTAIAFEDPNVVLAAYPNARVTYNDWGIYSVRDYELGIEFTWVRIPYPLLVEYVRMSIFSPSEPNEPPQPSLHSSNIVMEVNRRQVIASVAVEDNRGARVGGASVMATWTFPNGSTGAVRGTTDSYGNVQFEVRKSKGLFIFTINDIIKDGYDFDPDNSVLTDEIEVSGGRGKKK